MCNKWNRPSSMVPSFTVMSRYLKVVLMSLLIVQHCSSCYHNPCRSCYPIHFHNPEWQVRQRFVDRVSTNLLCNKQQNLYYMEARQCIYSTFQARLKQSQTTSFQQFTMHGTSTALWLMLTLNQHDRQPGGDVRRRPPAATPSPSCSSAIQLSALQVFYSNITRLEYKQVSYCRQMVHQHLSRSNTSSTAQCSTVTNMFSPLELFPGSRCMVDPI